MKSIWQAYVKKVLSGSNGLEAYQTTFEAAAQLEMGAVLSEFKRHLASQIYSKL